MQDKDNKGDRQRQGGTLCGGPWETIISAVVGPGGGRVFRRGRSGGNDLGGTNYCMTGEVKSTMTPVQFSLAKVDPVQFLISQKWTRFESSFVEQKWAGLTRTDRLFT